MSSIKKIFDAVNYVGGASSAWTDYLKGNKSIFKGETNKERLQRISNQYGDYKNTRDITDKLDEINKTLEKTIEKLRLGVPVSRQEIQQVETQSYNIPPPPPFIPKHKPIEKPVDFSKLTGYEAVLAEMRQKQAERAERMKNQTGGGIRKVRVGDYVFIMKK